MGFLFYGGEFYSAQRSGCLSRNRTNNSAKFLRHIRIEISISILATRNKAHDPRFCCIGLVCVSRSIAVRPPLNSMKQPMSAKHTPAACGVDLACVFHSIPAQTSATLRGVELASIE